jgi:hypothetical protein
VQAPSVIVRGSLAVAAVWVLTVANAAAQPGSGPRETVDQTYTTTKPNTPTGAGFTGVYHAANDPKGNPPYMRKMVFYPPAGSRFDSSVPDRCTATDIELETQGAAACPPGSKIGAGHTRGIIFEPVANAFAFTTYDNPVDILNNANEQIMVISSGGFGYTVVRGRARPDNSVEFAAPTCFPVPPSGVPCARDHVLQLGSATTMPRYTKNHRAYWTTPRTCPKRGYWRTKIKFWWADGSIDTVATDQPCKRRRR